MTWFGVFRFIAQFLYLIFACHSYNDINAISDNVNGTFDDDKEDRSWRCGGKWTNEKVRRVE